MTSREYGAGEKEDVDMEANLRKGIEGKLA